MNLRTDKTDEIIAFSLYKINEITRYSYSHDNLDVDYSEPCIVIKINLKNGCISARKLIAQNEEII